MTRLFRALIVVAALGFALVAYVYLTLPDVRALRTTNPMSTAFMELRAREAAARGKPLRHEHRWLAYRRISSSLKRAVLVAEDDAFWQHEGVDLEQLRETVEEDLVKGKPMRGASTITQQLAKNLYLSPSRDPSRKIRELIIARRLEAALPKDRILELYLNLIEWGDGVWGADAAARRYFGVSASSLSPSQAALMAGAIINPRVYRVDQPNRRLLRRQAIILSRMNRATPPEPSAPVDRGVPVESVSAPAAPAVESGADTAPAPDPAVTTDAAAPAAPAPPAD
ncbi:MAG: monofunctional biosynthetic peptidoglycan transglycosylase [Vicinamibacterales bacterium]